MKKNLSIAMYFSSDPSSYGGVQQCVYYLVQALKRRGHTVSVFGSDKTLLPYRSYRAIGEVIRIPWPNGNWVNITKGKEIREQLANIFSKEHFDICHIHEPYIPFVAWNFMRYVDVPKVATFHSAWDASSILSMVNSFIFVFQQFFSSNVDGAIFSTNLVKRLWLPVCDTSVKQRVIPFGIDKTLYVSKRKIHSGFTLLFVARLVEKKGLRYVLDILPSLSKKHPDLQLVIVGDGPEKASYERLVKRLHLSGQVIFKGSVSESEKVYLFQQSDLFLAPYVDEGFGITILEAISTGCPIVGFQNDAFSEVLAGYPAPFLLVPAKQSKQLGVAITRFMKDRDLQARLRKWCIKESKKYSWDAVAEQTEEFYYQILQSHSHGRRTPHEREVRQYVRFTYPTLA